MLALRILIALYVFIAAFLSTYVCLLIAYWAYTVILPTIGTVYMGIISVISSGFAVYYGLTAYNKMEN